MSTKTFILTRVGAAQGKAIFECDHLLGNQVEVADAAALKRVKAALQEAIEYVEIAVQDALDHGCYEEAGSIHSDITRWRNCL